jgi:DNA-binding transcriptional regulator YhcF (GntR family)
VTTTDDSIDWQSAEPYYQQSAQVLESRIASGTVERGARLSSGVGR